MMFVRLAVEDDFDAIVEMGRHNVETTKPEDPFDEDILRETLQEYVKDADPTVFVCEKDGRLIGFMFAGVSTYEYRAGFYTVQRVLYVRPENRGSRAAARMIEEFVRWSERLGAAEAAAGNDNGFQSERTAQLFECFGFKRSGFTLLKPLGESNG